MVLRFLRGLGIATLVMGYAFLAHYTNQSAHGNLGALVAIAPVILIALALAWHSPKRPLMLLLLGLLCIVLWASWSILELHFGLVYWLQHMGMQLILFMTFARTLFAGRKPLCTIFAEAVQAPLSPQHEIYTRWVTVAWALFFATMALVSTFLFFLAPLSTWSFFSNFLTLPLVALMFIAEYGVRRLTLPDTRNTHILDAVRAYRNSARPR